MSKQGGLGQRLLTGGFDISGDISALDAVHGGPAALDVTDITQSAHSRIGGLRDGGMGITTFFDTANAHPVLKVLPTTDVIVSYLLGTAIGSPVACVNAKQIGYDPTRAADGALTLKSQFDGNGFGLEWGVSLTPGLRTDTTATNGTSYDAAGGLSTPAVPASLTPVTNSSPMPVTVVITGGTMTNVSIGGTTVGTGAGTYTLPAGAAITLTYTVAPTWTWTAQTLFGGQGYLQVTGFTGTSVTVAIQSSPDNSTWTTLTGGTFTAVTAAPASQRIVVANNVTVGRYLRAITSGTFTSATFQVAFSRNPTAVVF